MKLKYKLEEFTKDGVFTFENVTITLSSSDFSIHYYKIFKKMNNRINIYESGIKDYHSVLWIGYFDHDVSGLEYFQDVFVFTMNKQVIHCDDGVWKVIGSIRIT